MKQPCIPKICPFQIAVKCGCLIRNEMRARYNRGMFIDQVTIFVKSGKGGDGMVHFRREKYEPRGGPDGGDGGKGGDVIFEVKPTLNSLSKFRPNERFEAEPGKGNISSILYHNPLLVKNVGYRVIFTPDYLHEFPGFYLGASGEESHVK